MRAGVSTASFFGEKVTEQAVDAIHGLGADTLEIFLHSYSEYTRDFARMLRQKTRGYGMRVHSVHALGAQFEPQLFSRNIRQRQDAWRIYEQVLRSARELRAKYYVFHGPHFIHGLHMRSRMDYTQIADVLMECSERAQKYGVVFTVENVHWCLCYCPEFVHKIIGAGAKDIQFTLDIKQAARSGYPVMDYIEAMAGSIRNVHVCDYRINEDGVELCLPGKGDADFAAIRRALKATGYDGPALLEVYADNYANEQELAESFAVVKNMFEGIATSIR